MGCEGHRLDVCAAKGSWGSGGARKGLRTVTVEDVEGVDGHGGGRRRSKAPRRGVV